jgi:ubiquinone/menaquinone biosynthesis C-methylase UbiE
MKEDNYWIKYWQKNKIINQSNDHAKVGRTIKGKPISEIIWKKTLTHIFKEINLKKNDVVLDLAAGSGSLAFPMSLKSKHVIAVDISRKLLDSIPKRKNISVLKGDIRFLKFENNTFDKIIFNFAIQHFTDKEVIELSTKLFSWLKVGGSLYIGDIPDEARLFKFYNNTERKKALFNSILQNKPIIGNWFHKQFLKEVFKSAGFNHVVLKNQPPYFINAHYRFDLWIKK